MQLISISFSHQSGPIKISNMLSRRFIQVFIFYFMRKLEDRYIWRHMRVELIISGLFVKERTFNFHPANLYLNLSMIGKQSSILILEENNGSMRYLIGSTCCWKSSIEDISFLVLALQMRNRTKVFYQLTVSPVYFLRLFSSILLLPTMGIEAFANIIRSSAKSKWDVERSSLVNGVGIEPFFAHSIKIAEKCAITISNKAM